MKRWSPDIIEKIRETQDIVEWIGRDTVLKPGSGGQYMGLCPFPDHQEKTPSFSVSSTKQVYHCFGCQKAGNIFTYFRDQKGMNFNEAIRYLANQSGISIQTEESDESVSNRNAIFSINKEVAQFYHRTLLELPSSHVARTYLHRRGYTEEIIQKFHIGYAPQRGELLQSFKDKQKSLELAGLLNVKGESVYEFFYRRLMFPIFSPMNHVLGFGARVLNDSLPKYMNSRDSLSFQKRKVFYGLNESAPFIRKKGYVLVMEGYTDFLTLFQYGFNNIVATLGVALTADHARLLKRYTDKVILFFDGDKAGKQATSRSLPLLLAEGLRVHQVELTGMDPDECIRKKGTKFLKTIIGQNQDLFLHTFFEKLKDKGDVEKLELVKEMASILSNMKDLVVKEYYKKRILDTLPLDQKSVQMIFNTAPRTAQPKKLILIKTDSPHLPKKEPKEVPNKVLCLNDIHKHELYLLVLALHQIDYWKYISTKMDAKLVSHPLLKEVFDMILKNDVQNTRVFDSLLAKVTRWVEPEIGLHIQNYPALLNLSKDKGFLLIDDCLFRLTLNHEHSRIRKLTMQLRLDQRNKEQYLKEIKNIKQNILSMENHHEK